MANEEKGAEVVSEPEEQDFYFSFGMGHTHPDTGEPLARRYVVLRGTWRTSRAMMLAHFGTKWSHQYESEEAIGVSRFGLNRLYLPGDAEYIDPRNAGET